MIESFTNRNQKKQKLWLKFRLRCRQHPNILQEIRLKVGNYNVWCSTYGHILICTSGSFLCALQIFHTSNNVLKLVSSTSCFVTSNQIKYLFIDKKDNPRLTQTQAGFTEELGVGRIRITNEKC